MPRRRLRSPRTRVRYDSPDDCCTGCCATCCCCCCWSRAMVARKSRIKMLWMYVLMIGLVIGITIGVVFYGSLFTDISASDMKVIDGKLSHLFCDSVNIDTANPTSDFAPFSAYIVGTPLKIDPTHKENYGFQLSFDFHQPWTYATRQFYLLSGSSAKLFCPQVTGIMGVVIIKGQANYTEFIQDSPNYQCVGCEYAHVIYNERHSGPNSWTFSDTDEYFFVFIGQESLWASCELDLTRTAYKTDISTSSCYKVTTCEFSLGLEESNPPKQIIVKLEPDKVASGKRYMYSTTSIQSTCVARLWVYIVLFLCCPGIVCIILSVLIYKFCADPVEDDDDDDDDISDEQSPLLWDSAPSYSGVVVTEPPKYEDIMADNDNQLPSYEEAVASGTFPAGNYGAVGNVGINHSEPLRNTDVPVNQADNLRHVSIIDVGATSRGPNQEANETDNTQGPESLNNFPEVSSSVNLDQTSRVLVMNLSDDVHTDDLVSPSDDLEPSSSDFDSDSSDSADSVIIDDGSEQVRNTSTDTRK
ncbi:uncharacterized protein LOC110463631 [Mizuhopecten yessoensis]|uniref:E3 ubiquitin-protein ligase APD1-4 middle domain-containing protein n=1 Tax=Mizuhopecten yessoensis TaxID=6573 RepID=A0A210PVN7_MIZYE|nr:uncharacterized protein LOC110463631 [Mizuhopecten yessoensis]OWF40557.1 hypothetical protein KP79_PYT19991 [Mizuhopecten yessoensis]